MIEKIMILTTTALVATCLATNYNYKTLQVDTNINEAKVPSKIQQMSFINDNSITIKGKKRYIHIKNLTIDIAYPTIQNLNNRVIENKINTTLKNFALSVEEDGLKLIKDIPEGREGAVNLHYEVPYNEKNILSVKFTGYSYSGGAHGSHIQKSFTFNLGTGDQLGLKNLFNENFDYISLINSEISKQIASKGIMPESLPSSISPDQNFYLKNNSLVIYYIDLPYVLGIPEFEIPFSLFGNSIKLSKYI